MLIKVASTARRFSRSWCCAKLLIALAAVFSQSYAESKLLAASQWELLAERNHDVELSQQADELDIRSTGNDPYVVGKLTSIKSTDRVLQFDYRSATGVKDPEIFVGPPFSKATQSKLPAIPIAEGWQTYSAPIVGNGAVALAKRPTLLRLDLGKQADVRIWIRNLHLRSMTAAEREQESRVAEVRAAKLLENQRTKDYLTQSFPIKFDAIEVSSDSIRMSGGSLPAGYHAADLRLVEYPPWHSIGSSDQGIRVDVPLKLEGNRWQVSVPRFESKRDRLHHGWRLQVDGKYLTARQFATQIQTQGNDYPRQRPMPANQKGMGGIAEGRQILDELLELGITAVTVNIFLNRYLSFRAQPGFERIDVPGPPVYFNPKAFAHDDSLIAWASRHKIVVSAILLIARNPAYVSSLQHPESDGGNYAMPDLTSARGAGIYAFILDRLAKRYSNPNGPHGGITNWIAHNEIDFHTVWTNMGRQPRDLVTETYYRSMRMIHNAARQYNPYARVFASLTHHWVVPEDDQWQQLSPRDLLVSLQRYSISEGDFAWGVAYHPYPESLFAPVAWADKTARDDINSPLITIQNIEVLGTFLDHSFMRDSDRQPRAVLFSEQGFHTDSYAEEAQARQAGSLAYAMSKISAMPMVESFHYHRWIDHPKEGGLKMGLRTLPTKEQPFGTKKLSWDVYRAIGTDAESAAIEDLPGPNNKPASNR